MADSDCPPTRICAKCKIPKGVTDFYASKRFKDGLRKECKLCEKSRAMNWRNANLNRARQSKREWSAVNQERARDYAKSYHQANIDIVRAKARQRAAKLRSENPELIRARNLTWKRLNPEKNRAAAREWARANTERNRARARRWAELNNARVIANVMAYAKLHPEVQRLQAQRRRAALALAKVRWEDDFFIAEIYDLARKRTEITGFAWQVDHIVPIKSKLVCGLHVHWNLAVIPAHFNRRKSNRHWPDMP